MESASLLLSSVSPPHSPAALTCPNARSALTDRLACLREGGGKKGTWMNEGGKKIPILRLAGRAHWRSAILPGFFGGGGIESLSAPPLSSSSLSFRGPPTRTSGLPGALFCLLSNAWKNPPPTHAHTHTLFPTLSNVRTPQLNAVMEEQERPPCI